MNIKQTPNCGPPPICAIGASAGGVRALQDFFGAIEDDLGLAYVLVIHLAPDHPSQLAAVIAERTAMSVKQVENASTLRPNCVYVIAPGRELVIKGDKLVARPLAEPRSKRAPIDMLFRSVAAAHGDGLAVVLSGSGSDGTLGIRTIKEAGGIIFVQDPDEAEYPAMPQSAIASRAVDFIAPVPTLVQRIAEVARSRKALHKFDEEHAEEGACKIINLLQRRTGHDFSRYSRTMFMRRVARRMQLSRHDNVGSYVHYLRSKSDEVQELLAELLTSVTSFFRGGDAFRTLSRKAIEPIFKRLGESEGIRAWVIGCATGEETYSVAMLLLEGAASSNFHGPVQIFASDIDQKALAVAREGRYPKTIAADVSEERLRRFFIEDDEHYCVRDEVRERILFASHDALKDPPFIRIDLIVCRNLVIYLDQEPQQQLYAVLHYALKPGGYLFLGAADIADPEPGLFHPIEPNARLYAAKPSAKRALPVFQPPVSARLRALQERSQEQRLHAPPLADTHLSALERQSPPSALVDAGHRVLHLSPNAGRFIRPSEGPLSADISQLVRPELRLDLEAALQRAFGHKESTLTLPITMEVEGKRRRIMAYVALAEADDASAPHALVWFLDAGAPEPLEETGSASAEQAGQQHELVQELALVRERLIASERQYAEALQELGSSNEELQETTEEYRSTVDELQNSKEELLSINEDQTTRITELQSQLDAASARRSDLQNLVAATEIGVLFLDEQLRIRFFTPAIVKLFNIAHADLGRAVTDFTNRLKYDSVESDAKKVLESLVPIELEVEARDGSWLMMRMRPYRTIENRIGGVVLTFTDVTDLKRVEAWLANELSAMTRLQQLSTRIIESAELEPPLLSVLDAAIDLLGADLGHIQLYDRRSGKLHLAAQRGFDEPLLDRFRDYLPDENISANWAPGRAVVQRSQILIEDIEKEPGFAQFLEWATAAGFRAVQSTPLVAADGKVVGVLSTHFHEPHRFSAHDLRLIDICARQAADSINAYLLQESVRKSETRLRQVLETERVGVLFLDRDGTIIEANNAFLQMLGYARAEIDARELTWRKLTPPEWIALSEE